MTAAFHLATLRLRHNCHSQEICEQIVSLREGSTPGMTQRKMSTYARAQKRILSSASWHARGNLPAAIRGGKGPNKTAKVTRNTWLAKPREARVGWTVDFYFGCTACDIPIYGAFSPLFPPDGAVFAEQSYVVCALWFPDVSFFATRAESEVFFHVVKGFRCLISVGESVLSLIRPPVVHLHHNLFVFHQ